MAALALRHDAGPLEAAQVDGVEQLRRAENGHCLHPRQTCSPDRPRPDVRHHYAELCLLRVRLDPVQVLTPPTGPRALALLHWETDEGDAEGVHRLLAAVGPFVEGLVQDVVVGTPEAAADDLL